MEDSMGYIVKLNHLSPELIERLDAEVGIAVCEVQQEGIAKAQVSLSFDVTENEDGDTVVAFTKKRVKTEKGTWQPVRQARLALEG